VTEAKAWEIVLAIRDYVEASHTTSARPRQPFLAAMVKALVAPDYEPPKATPVGNLNELLAHVDVPEPAPDPGYGICSDCWHSRRFHRLDLPEDERYCTAPTCRCKATMPFLPQNTEPGRSPPETEPSKAMETAAAIVKTFG